MKGLKETLARLSALRSRFERLLSSAGARRGTSTPPAAQHLRRRDDFGSNPGNLRMLSYMPQGCRRDVRWSLRCTAALRRPPCMTMVRAGQTLPIGTGSPCFS